MFIIKGLVSLLLVTSIVSYTFPYDGDVIVLTDNTINAAIKQYDYLLVEFYASWCGHCKQFAPEYSQFATQVKETGQPFVVAKLNGGDTDKQAMNKYKVTSFPTIILLIKGYAVPYNGDRNANQLLNFVNNAIADQLIRIEDIDEVHKFIKDNNLALLYFPKDESQLNTYNFASKIFPNIKFGYTTSAYARKLYDVEEGQIVLFRTFEDRRKEYTDKITLEKLVEFLYEHSTPSFEELDSKSFQNIFNKNTPSLILLWNHQNSEPKEILKQLAPHIKKRITVTSIHQGNSQLHQVLPLLFINQPTYPSLYYYKTTNEVYTFNEEYTVENIMRFIHNSNSGKLFKRQKSQPIPTQKNTVIKLVGETFQNIVLDSNKDVFVQFCQEQQSKCYEPEFEDLAKELKNNDELIFAQIDLSNNDVDGVRFENYPTFRLYKAKLSSNPITFDQEFSLDNLKLFLSNNLKIKIGSKSDL